MTRVERLLRAPALPVVAAVAPIVAVAARALARGWIPVGDNAYFAVRAADVATEHHPLVGAWSSGSVAVGVEVNNLGPLQLDLLALPVKLLGWGPGTVVGVALTNALAAAFVVVAARARLGWWGAWLGALTVAALCWTLGSELLIEPRQHHALVLPLLAVLAGVWCCVAGDERYLPWTAAVASLVAQTHLSFVVPLAVLGLAVATAVAVAWWRGGNAERRSIGLHAGVALVVLLLCWAQPAVDQLWGDQNLSAVLEAGQTDQPSYGAAAAARATATVLGPPDGWLRPAFRAFDPASGLVGPVAAAGTLAVVGTALVVTGVLAHRRGGRSLAALCATAAVGLVGAWAGAAASPTSGAFGAVSGNFRFLWPVAAITWLAIAAAAMSLLRRPDPSGGSDEPHRRAVAPSSEGRIVVATAGVAVATVALAVATVPTSYQSPGPEEDAPRMPVAEALAAGLDPLEGVGTVVVDRSGLFFGEPYTYVVLAGLQERGIPFTFDTTTDVARFGDDRRETGEEAGVVHLRAGAGATRPRGPAEELVTSARQPDGTPVAVWFTPAR